MKKKFSFKKNLVLKKKFNFKKKIEKDLDKLYPNNKLHLEELNYDFTINDKFINQMSKKKETQINFELLNKLPTLQCNIDILNIDVISNNDDSIDDSETISNTEIELVNELDIDTDSLEKEQVGEKYYYFGAKTFLSLWT